MIPSIWEPYNKQIRLEYIMDGGMHKAVYNKVSNYKIWSRKMFSQRYGNAKYCIQRPCTLLLHYIMMPWHARVFMRFSACCEPCKHACSLLRARVWLLTEMVWFLRWIACDCNVKYFGDVLVSLLHNINSCTSHWTVATRNHSSASLIQLSIRPTHTPTE